MSAFRSLAYWSVLVAAASTPAARIRAQGGFDWEKRVGIAVTKPAGSHCLWIDADSIAPGTTVLLASPADSAAVVTARVLRRRTAPCPAPDPDIPLADAHYDIEILGRVRPQPGSVWFAVLAAPGALAATANGIRGDLDGDGNAEMLRVCTSAEGLHLTVWTGAPLTGRRRWHRYFYLQYDVEPTCDERDFQDPNASSKRTPPSLPRAPTAVGADVRLGQRDVAHRTIGLRGDTGVVLITGWYPARGAMVRLAD
jgi:hypothetical protein